MATQWLMSIGNEKLGEMIDSYYGEFKKGLLGKKYPVRLYIYPSHIEGIGYFINANELSNDGDSFTIPFLKICKVYTDTISGVSGLVIEYIEDSIISNKSISKLFFPSITESAKWVNILTSIQNELREKDLQANLLKKQTEENERKQRELADAESTKFYFDCFNFHIKNTTPQYELYRDKNKIALIYIGEDRSLNFLKIDGDAKEESNGLIPFDKIHYYEKAGDIHYLSEIHGDYSSYGGSITGGDFSKLATVGGGLLFGMMGMAAGALLSYRPTQSEGTKTNFSISSDTKQIDARNVILNFYSDIKKQYIDIELPNDIYNFLQTHLPEKKYNIVLELEKKAAIKQASEAENNKLLQSPTESDNIHQLDGKQILDPMIDFKKKVEKLKIMKDAGLLTDEEFNVEKSKLLEMI